MQHLIRKRFLERTWDAAELDLAAEFWLRLFEEAAANLGLALDSLHGVEIRLRGFPRQQAEALQRELMQRLAAPHGKGGDFPFPDIEQPDPNTITVSSGLMPGREAPPSGLGLPLLAGPPFDGLCVEVRIRAEGVKQSFLRRTRLPTTLVLVGELRDGELLLKSLWRAGPSESEDELCWAGVWPEQDMFLEALEEFGETGEVPRKLAGKLFVSRGADRGGRLAVRLIHVPLHKPRLAGLLIRLLVFSALFAGLGFALYHLLQRERHIWLLVLAIPAWCVLWLAWNFAKNEARLWFVGYHEFHRRYTKLYETSVKHLTLEPAEAQKRSDHPWARKYTAELEAAGFTHAGDLRFEPELNGENLVRVFYAPDGVTYLSVLFCMSTSPDPAAGFRMWPAAVSFLTHTYYAEGGRAASISGQSGGYRKKRSGPENLTRVFAEAEDPIAFTRLHMAAAAAFAQETGRTPLRHESFTLHLRRQDDIHEEQRRLYAEAPYTWGDHVHWYLQWPRREYLAPG